MKITLNDEIYYMRVPACADTAAAGESSLREQDVEHGRGKRTKI